MAFASCAERIALASAEYPTLMAVQVVTKDGAEIEFGADDVDHALGICAQWARLGAQMTEIFRVFRETGSLIPTVGPNMGKPGDIVHNQDASALLSILGEVERSVKKGRDDFVTLANGHKVYRKISPITAKAILGEKDAPNVMRVRDARKNGYRFTVGSSSYYAARKWFADNPEHSVMYIIEPSDMVRRYLMTIECKISTSTSMPA